MKTWQVQDAKQRFSELVQRALDEGPQVVTRRGKEAVVVVSADTYRRLAQTQSRPDFKTFLACLILFVWTNSSEPSGILMIKLPRSSCHCSSGRLTRLSNIFAKSRTSNS